MLDDSPCLIQNLQNQNRNITAMYGDKFPDRETMK